MADKTSDDPSFLRVDEPTPSGGAYSTCTWLDDARNVVPRSQASGGEIVEYSADGQQVGRTYFTQGPLPAGSETY